MPPSSSTSTTPRIGARVLLLDPHDRVLLIHARDPDQPEHHWWELPGGGQEPGEHLHDTAHREIAEETGLILDNLGPHLWTRESHFHYRGQHHHRIDHVYLARVTQPSPLAPTPTANEAASVIERRWWTPAELTRCRDKLLPAQLPHLVQRLLADMV